LNEIAYFKQGIFNLPADFWQLPLADCKGQTRPSSCINAPAMIILKETSPVCGRSFAAARPGSAARGFLFFFWGQASWNKEKQP
jgi:hypothetical protein